MLHRLLYLITLLALVVFYGAYQGWTGWILLMAGIMFPWLSLILSLPAMVKCRLYLPIPSRMAPGSRETAALSVRCPGVCPAVTGRIRISRPLTGQSWILRPGDPLPTDHCGVLRAEPFRVYVWDYLGLFRRKARAWEPGCGCVFPEPVPMGELPELTRYLSCRWRPKSGGGFAENHELRPYRPGDSLNQIHWKLSAKTGQLILREPMEPEQTPVLLTLDISGTPGELDRKFGRLLWLSRYILDLGLPLEIQALTGEGPVCCSVIREGELEGALKTLLGSTPAGTGSIRDMEFRASWQYHIGGEADEA